MRQYSLFLLFFLTGLGLFGQQAVHNFGNLQLHQKGLVGFHTNLINDGNFDNNLGMIGFYHEAEGLSISGAFSPTFYDFETAVERDLNLEVSININNSLNFIYGNIKSPRANRNVYAKLSEKAFYNGFANGTKIDGNTAVEGQKKFIFPVGYDQLARPLQISFVDGIFLAKCEYFHEDPNLPFSFSENFDITQYDNSLEEIYGEEFWNITTTGLIQITLNWTAQVNFPDYVEDIGTLTVVGWDRKDKRWENLGNVLHEGTLEDGSVMSNAFNANDYEIVTFGFLFNFKANEPGNYAMTPNNDGSNDVFQLKIIEQSPHNKIKIFNRSGRIVYEKTDYRNDFVGISNKIGNGSDQKLAKGVYFYILELTDLNQTYQGYIYLAD